jgi:hypothetical protein
LLNVLLQLANKNGIKKKKTAIQAVICALLVISARKRRDLIAEAKGWQMEDSQARELAACIQRLELQFGVRWSPMCKDVSPETEEHSPLKAATKQCY